MVDGRLHADCQIKEICFALPARCGTRATKRPRSSWLGKGTKLSMYLFNYVTHIIALDSVCPTLAHCTSPLN